MNKPTAEFIRLHADDDVRQLALRGTKDAEVDLPAALDQIAGRQTARRKLPSWAAVEGIAYPPHLSMEQCSSEQTARYKTRFTDKVTSLLDLTGGFGVDFAFMAQAIVRAMPSSPHRLVYVERQVHLCETVRHNLDLLGLSQAEVVCDDSVSYLSHTEQHFDLIFLDPARRDSHGGRTYGISDCTPDVLAIRDLLLSKARHVMLKLSPMLDWRKAVADLGEQSVREVHIVSVDNECKELLVLLESGKTEAGNHYSLHCTNLLADGARQSFVLQADTPTPFTGRPRPAEDARYLYEPNASIMKAGCFAEVERTFGLSQLSANSHLFVSTDYVDNFPGRVFQIDAVSTMNKRELNKHLQGMNRANITVRNFPLTVAELRKRLKLSEGGSTYIFATTLADKSHVLLITRKQCTESQSR